ncbi:MAG: hypothetical protein WC449_02080 [Candidatus Paceibacterota bacterium]
MTYHELQKKFPTFHYRDYSWQVDENNDFVVDFAFVAGEHEFFPRVRIKNIVGLEAWVTQAANKPIIDTLVFNLGLIELFSYWKAFCSPKIIIEKGTLSQKQAVFWKKLLLQGMGQYFYENNIVDFSKKNFVDFSFSKAKSVPTKHFKTRDYLFGLGGGKDSAVGIEVFKKASENFSVLMLNPIPSSLEMAKISGAQDQVIIERKICPKLLELNQQGFLNGHTPFSAYLAFLGTLCAILGGYKGFVVANENSANEESLIWQEKKINHQYSKSLAFEKDFRRYLSENISRDLEYFSIIRPLNEIKCAQIFSSLTQYHKIFLSCNVAQRSYSGTKKPTFSWCGNCSKCLFAYLILYPFLGKEKAIEIFGSDLFENSALIGDLEALSGYTQGKPLECVGMRLETLAALKFGLEYNRQNALPDQVLLKRAREILAKKKISKTQLKALFKLQKNFLPKKLLAGLKTLL